MFVKRLIHIILIATLFIQLLPTNQAGRFYFSNLPDEESADMTATNSLRQLVEEDIKDVHLEHEWVVLPSVNITKLLFHFQVDLPQPHPGAIPTPPPNYFSA